MSTNNTNRVRTNFDCNIGDASVFRMCFANGCSVSVHWGQFCHSEEADLTGAITVECLVEDSFGNQVRMTDEQTGLLAPARSRCMGFGMGYCNAADVLRIMNYAANLSSGYMAGAAAAAPKAPSLLWLQPLVAPDPSPMGLPDEDQITNYPS